MGENTYKTPRTTDWAQVNETEHLPQTSKSRSKNVFHCRWCVDDDDNDNDYNDDQKEKKYIDGLKTQR